MRHLFLLLSLVLGTMAGQAQVEVSETVELMSVLSRTAGFEEYNMDMAGKYTQDTEAWFAPFKQHPIIPYYKELRAKYGISHDAVMVLAIHLTIEKGRVKFVGTKSDLEQRWQEVDVEDFVQRLNAFYKDTKFHQFFDQHRSFYAEGVKAFEESVLSTFHQDWYARFYGTEPVEVFRFIIGFTNGAQNYGPSRQLPGQPKEVISIIGYWTDRRTGQLYGGTEELAKTLIHEFNHSFVNPLLDNAANAALMEQAGRKLYKLSEISMKQQSYGDWQTLINESIVRAAVVLYMLDYNFPYKQVVNEMSNQLCLDFNWMPELVTCLRHYASHRDAYKTLGDYYPEIARCLNQYLEHEAERVTNSLK